MLGFGIFCWEINSAPTEVQVFDLYSHELTCSATQLINRLEHQLVIIIVNTVEKILEFINGQVADVLAKTFIPLGVFASSAQSFCVGKIILVNLHSNVKSAGLINVSNFVQQKFLCRLRDTKTLNSSACRNSESRCLCLLVYVKFVR